MTFCGCDLNKENYYKDYGNTEWSQNNSYLGNSNKDKDKELTNHAQLCEIQTIQSFL